MNSMLAVTRNHQCKKISVGISSFLNILGIGERVLKARTIADVDAVAKSCTRCHGLTLFLVAAMNIHFMFFKVKLMPVGTCPNIGPP